MAHLFYWLEKGKSSLEEKVLRVVKRCKVEETDSLENNWRKVERRDTGETAIETVTGAQSQNRKESDSFASMDADREFYVYMRLCLDKRDSSKK